MTEPSPREEGDHGPPPAVRVHKNQMEHSGDDSKGDDKGRAARETVAGAMRMTETTVATAAIMTKVAMLMPNSDEDNKDGNSKNNNKAMAKPSATAEGGEHCQSHRDNCAGEHHPPWDANIVPTAALSRHAFVRSCCFPVERFMIFYYACEYIENVQIWQKDLPLKARQSALVNEGHPECRLMTQLPELETKTKQ